VRDGAFSLLPLGEGAPKGRMRVLRTRVIQHHASASTLTPARPAEAQRALSSTSMWTTLRAAVPAFNIVPDDVVSRAARQCLANGPPSPPLPEGEGLKWTWLPALLLALLLTGCITRPKPPSSQPPAITETDRQIWLNAHPNWSFTGRVALRQQGKGGSGRIEWQQRESRYSIRLSAPVTRQSWQLSGNLADGHARIEGIEGGPLDSTDAEALLQETTGWDIPVRSLTDWVRGLSYSADTDEARPQQFQHEGWSVTYPLWHPATDTLPPLPKRIEVERVEGGTEAPRIRLVIDRWEFP